MDWRNKTLVFFFAVTLLLIASLLLYPSTFLRPLSSGGVFDDEAESLQNDPLGIVMIDITSEETASRFHVTQMGVYVLAVREDSPADLAGIRSGDQILSFESRPVISSLDISQSEMKEENQVRLVTLRDGKENSILLYLPPANAD